MSNLKIGKGYALAKFRARPPTYPDVDNRAHGRKLLADLDWLMVVSRHSPALRGLFCPLPAAPCWVCAEADKAADRIMAREVGC